jgi:hypothetical protein
VRAEVGGGRDWHTLAAKGLAEAGEGIGRLPPNKSENWKNRRVRRRLRECCEDVARMLRGWSLFLFSPRLLSVVSSERRETQSVVNGVGPCWARGPEYGARVEGARTYRHWLGEIRRWKRAESGGAQGRARPSAADVVRPGR